MAQGLGTAALDDHCALSSMSLAPGGSSAIPVPTCGKHCPMSKDWGCVWRVPSCGVGSAVEFAHLEWCLCPTGTGHVGWLSPVTKTALPACTAASPDVFIFYSQFPQNLVVTLCFLKRHWQKQKPRWNVTRVRE